MASLTVLSDFTSDTKDRAGSVWTVHGGAVVSGGALQLISSGDWLDTPYSPKFHFTNGEDVTIRCKAKVPSFASDRRVLITTRRDSGATKGWAIYANPSSLEFIAWNGSVVADKVWSSSYPFDTEFELSLERKGMVWYLYINTTQVGSAYTQVNDYDANPVSWLSIGTEFNTDGSADHSRDLVGGSIRYLQIIKGLAMGGGGSTTPAIGTPPEVVAQVRTPLAVRSTPPVDTPDQIAFGAKGRCRGVFALKPLQYLTAYTTDGSAKPSSSTGVISGVVSIQGTVASRKVRLYNKSTGQLIAQVMSSSDGAYTFINLDPSFEYFAVSHDYQRNFNAVIQDMIQP